MTKLTLAFDGMVINKFESFFWTQAVKGTNCVYASGQFAAVVLQRCAFVNIYEKYSKDELKKYYFMKCARLWNSA